MLSCTEPSRLLTEHRADGHIPLVCTFGFVCFTLFYSIPFYYIEVCFIISHLILFIIFLLYFYSCCLEPVWHLCQHGPGGHIPALLSAPPVLYCLNFFTAFIIFFGGIFGARNPVVTFPIIVQLVAILSFAGTRTYACTKPSCTLSDHLAYGYFPLSLACAKCLSCMKLSCLLVNTCPTPAEHLPNTCRAPVDTCPTPAHFATAHILAMRVAIHPSIHSDFGSASVL
jgi:hypothetical protein